MPRTSNLMIMSKRKRSYYEKSPLAKLWGKFSSVDEITEERMPDTKTLDYLESSYPSNHNYVLKQGKLLALGKLSKRYKSISIHYPEGMQSLLDTSCSKGYFNFDAVQSYGCKRSLGIDVLETELEACAAVKKYLNAGVAHFEEMRLHDLASRIDEFGGPFDATLVINCYQYLYFGSSRFNAAYMNHDSIFADLRKVCDGRVIFSNRIEVKHLQEYPAKQAEGMKELYDEQTIYAAASKYFNVNRMGKLGRYPLWTLDAL